MANEKKIDVVILGYLYHEPMSGYDIKKRIDNELKYFFNGSYGSIYPALCALEQDGKIEREEIKDTNRGKILYRITDKGVNALKEWISSEGNKDELRYETLLKIFFGGSVGNKATIKQIESFEKKINGELKMLNFFQNNLLNVIDEDEDHLYFLLTVKFGIETYNGHLNWCREAKKILKEREK